MNSNNRSPLKDRPLRDPGQSLDEQINDLIYDKLATPFFAAIFACALAGIEWWRFAYPRPPAPKTYTALALLVVIYCIWQTRRVWRQLLRLRLARDGEKVVGQYLERLREQGYVVFHDVIGTDFNIDHVIIGPAGIFTIETKTRSKPNRGDAKIIFDGEKILVGGVAPDRDPVIQAKAQAHWLKALLAESTGRKFEIRPVIVFPGWFIEQQPGSKRQMWVLEPKALPSFLANEPGVLSVEDVRLASFHLTRFIRSQY